MATSPGAKRTLAQIPTVVPCAIEAGIIDARILRVKVVLEYALAGGLMSYGSSLGYL
jgi:hypothetical protein